MMRKQNRESDAYDHYCLTIKEAAEYFHIGQKKLRRMANENYNAPYFLRNGNRVYIKKKLFEEQLDKMTVI